MCYFTCSTTGGHRTAQSWQRVKKSPQGHAKNIREHWKCLEQYKMCHKFKMSTAKATTTLHHQCYVYGTKSDQGNSLESPAMRRGKEVDNSPKAAWEKENLQESKRQLQHWRWGRRNNFANPSVSSCCRRATFD